MDKRGFTLTELIIVVAIISILAAIAIPAYVGQQKNAARQEAYSNLENLRLLEEQFFAENGGYAPLVPGTINYTATDPPAANTLEFILRGFRPGGCLNCASPYGLNFTYSITTTDTNADGIADTFTTSATPIAGSRVAGDPTYTINQNNVKNW